MQTEYFFAAALSAARLEMLLAAGWRKFGLHYFRPCCELCRECIPLRVVVDRFEPSKSQRRAVRTAAAVRAEFKPLAFREEIFEIYRDHARIRFGTEHSRDDFIQNFYLPSCPTMQVEYTLGDHLIAIGFVDIAETALSTVYFAFRPEYDGLSLGTVSIVTEIDYARRLGLTYYYLGYCVAGNRHMAYKGRFLPHQVYDWATEIWENR
jgi:arginyl-tRNA--protein-N-Asp/Glu arginylyltransferase